MCFRRMAENLDVVNVVLVGWTLGAGLRDYFRLDNYETQRMWQRRRDRWSVFYCLCPLRRHVTNKQIPAFAMVISRLRLWPTLAAESLRLAVYVFSGDA